MKTKKVLLALILILACTCEVIASEPGHPSIQNGNQARRINLIISSRVTKIDPAPLSFQVQAWLRRCFRRKTVFVIVAGSSREMAEKAEKILNREHAMIGNLWFDSHGHYAKRHSLFELGEDEFNYNNIRDSIHTQWLRKLAAFCDETTRVGIGSCYGGATYFTPAVEEFHETRMNGDSLMMGLSAILNRATVFASESWVMSGPGVFHNAYALSGYPPRRKFTDQIFEPVWEKLGKWNCYEGNTGNFFSVNTVSLDKRAVIHVQPGQYIDKKRHQKCQARKMNALKAGRYNLAYLYQ